MNIVRISHQREGHQGEYVAVLCMWCKWSNANGKSFSVHSHKVVAGMTCSNVQLTHRQISLFAVVAAVFGRMVRVDHGYQACVSSDCGARVKTMVGA